MTKANGVRDAHLDTLAERLIARHLRLSVPDSAVRDQLVVRAGDERYPRRHIESRMRCIAVVGAGASSPLLARGDELADQLEAEFHRDEAMLERLNVVNGFDPKHFETRLIALSTRREVADKVRETISAKYNVRQPTLLAYELLAHLLKHRFLDAIVSFNFDELLDQSLIDELGDHEFHPIVSERDCADVPTDPDASAYVPLYVKLHGTASEPRSLRFTPDSYFSLPTRMVNVVRDLLRSEHCVIVNVGSGLASFDFQRLLQIPQTLEVYDLSMKPLASAAVEQITIERERLDPGNHVRPWQFDCCTGETDCGSHLKDLVARLEERASRSDVASLVRVRSVRRHVTVARLLGERSMDTRWRASPWFEGEQRDYLERRTILELAFAGAKARGLLSLAPLAHDRPARYFEEYRRRIQGSGAHWRKLCSAAGLLESEMVPDILLSSPDLRRDTEAATGDDTIVLHEFDPDRLARHVLARVKNDADDDDVNELSQTVAELQRQSDVEIHTTDDRICSKAFRRPAILRTETSMRAYTSLMLDGLTQSDDVFVSSETGAWLCDPAVVDQLAPCRLHVLVAFETDRDDLMQRYPSVELVHCDPWLHNRHMTVVSKNGNPARAIYFARRLRSPVITPVYLDGARDVERLLKMYDQRFAEAQRMEDELRRRLGGLDETSEA